LQSLAPTPVSRKVDVRQAAGRKIIAESLSQHEKKHVVPTPLSGIKLGKRFNKSKIVYSLWVWLNNLMKVRIQYKMHLKDYRERESTAKISLLDFTLL
jgi:hypothetical protein